MEGAVGANSTVPPNRPARPPAAQGSSHTTTSRHIAPERLCPARRAPKRPQRLLPPLPPTLHRPWIAPHRIPALNCKPCSNYATSSSATTFRPIRGVRNSGLTSAKCERHFFKEIPSHAGFLNCVSFPGFSIWRAISAWTTTTVGHQPGIIAPLLSGPASAPFRSTASWPRKRFVAKSKQENAGARLEITIQLETVCWSFLNKRRSSSWPADLNYDPLNYSFRVSSSSRDLMVFPRFTRPAPYVPVGEC